jgi:hypothetical protein
VPLTSADLLPGDNDDLLHLLDDVPLTSADLLPGGNDDFLHSLDEEPLTSASSLPGDNGDPLSLLDDDVSPDDDGEDAASSLNLLSLNPSAGG